MSITNIGSSTFIFVLASDIDAEYAKLVLVGGFIGINSWPFGYKSKHT